MPGLQSLAKRVYAEALRIAGTATSWILEVVFSKITIVA